MTITVWETPNCRQCIMTKQVFDVQGAVYDRVDLSADENTEALQAFRESIGGSPDAQIQMPIVTTPTDSWQGFRPEKIQAAAQEQVTQQAAVLNNPAVSGPRVG